MKVLSQNAQTYITAVIGVSITQVACDLGYRGHGVNGKDILVVPRDKRKGTATLKKWWRRRNAIEPIIGHEKSDHRLERNRLAGELGDQMNVVLSACGFNFKKLWRAFCAWLQIQAQVVLHKDQRIVFA